MNLNSQEFKKANDYFLTEIDSAVLKKYWENYPSEAHHDPISIFLKDQNDNLLFEIKIEELETYRGTTIEILEIEDLDNIRQVIHLESSYDACCSNHYSTYLLETLKGDLVKLPETEYLHCDGPTPIMEYRFPNQKFGQKNKILLTKSIFNNEFKVESVEIQKTYVWDGKNCN